MLVKGDPGNHKTKQSTTEPCVYFIGNIMMTSSNGNIFRVTGPLCGEFTSPGEFPTQRPVTRSFDVFFDLRRNKPLSKQPWGWWFETPSWSFWCQCNVLPMIIFIYRCIHIFHWRLSYYSRVHDSTIKYNTAAQNPICLMWQYYTEKHKNNITWPMIHHISSFNRPFAILSPISI